MAEHPKAVLFAKNQRQSTKDAFDAINVQFSKKDQ
jgi:hypothetical protein